LGILLDDLYIEPGPWPRIGRPPRHDVEAWTVTDGWPDALPITGAGLEVFGAWFDDLSASRCRQAICDQAQADAARAAAMLETSGQQAITPQMVQRFRAGVA
jgi:hypothetical protein